MMQNLYRTFHDHLMKCAIKNKCHEKERWGASLLMDAENAQLLEEAGRAGFLGKTGP